MHEHRHAMAGDDLDQGGDVILVRMHAAGRKKSHDMHRALRRFRLVDQRQQHGTARQAAILDGHINARQVLGDDAARADIHVAHFGIAHLPLGQTDRIAGGGQQGMGTFAQQAGVVGRLGLGDGIVGIVAGAPAPTVQNAK